MIRLRYESARSVPVVAHVTTTDISLALLLGPQLKAFLDAGFEVVGISSPGPFVQQIETLGVQHIPLTNATRALSLHSDVKALGELYRILRRIRPDIIHTHNPKPGIYGRVAGALAQVPLVVNTVHGLYATDDDRVARRAVVYTLERLAASFSDAELVQNPEDLERLRRLRIPAKRLHMLGNGIDLVRFSRGPHFAQWREEMRAQLGAGDNDVVVTAVGRLVWEKGYAELFEAAREVLGSHRDTIFVVGGPDEPSKSDAVDQASLSAARKCGIRFLGHVNDVERLYAGSDIYVLASHREGFPRSAMEAAAMGLPIVATNIRGCRQVVEDGVNGFLVPPKDSARLAAALARLIAQRELRYRMGQAGTAKALADFDQQRVIRTTLDVYAQLLASRGTRLG